MCKVKKLLLVEAGLLAFGKDANAKYAQSKDLIMG